MLLGDKKEKCDTMSETRKGKFDTFISESVLLILSIIAYLQSEYFLRIKLLLHRFLYRVWKCGRFVLYV